MHIEQVVGHHTAVYRNETFGIEIGALYFSVGEWCEFIPGVDH